jgi:energy-coupling factor transporter transmembrane protein EcfT
VAMDARGFGSGPRTTYRPVAWTSFDATIAAAGVLILVAALIVSR